MVELCAMNPLLVHPEGAFAVLQKLGAIDIYDLVLRTKVCSLLADPVDHFGHGKLVTFTPGQDSVLFVSSNLLMENSLQNGAQLHAWDLPPEINPTSLISLFCRDSYLIFHAYEENRLLVHYCEFNGKSIVFARTDIASSPISPPYIEWAPSGRMRFILAGLDLNILFWNNQARYWFNQVLPPIDALESLWLFWNPVSDWCLFNAAYIPNPAEWPLDQPCPPHEIQALALSIGDTGVYTVNNPVRELAETPKGLESFLVATEYFYEDLGLKENTLGRLGDLAGTANYAVPVPRAGLICLGSTTGGDLTFLDI